MSPKRSTTQASTMPRSRAKQLKAEADMRAEVKRVVDLNTPTTRAGAGSLSVRNTQGKAVRLVGADGKPTLFGAMYYQELGVEAPKTTRTTNHFGMIFT